MTEQTITALLVILGTILTAAQARTSWRLSRLGRENRALWFYTRHLIDWGYRPRIPGEPPPEPPKSIAHLYDFGDRQS